MTTFTVTTLSDVVDPGDGRLSLREAVNTANVRAGADRIEFAAGIEGGRLVLTGGELVATDDLTVDGSRSNVGRTTIDGNDQDRILQVDGSGIAARVEDLRITNGFVTQYTPEGFSHERGAGINVDSGNILTAARSRIDNNYVGGYYSAQEGGGIFLGSNGSLNITDSELVSNRGGYGGAIYAAEGSDVSIARSSIENNLAYSGRGGQGGGVLIRDGSLLISASTIRNNSSSVEGGGVDADGGLTTIVNSTVSGNSLSYRGGYGNGAGVAVDGDGYLIVNRSTITGNELQESVRSYGGGIYFGSHQDGSLTISNSIVAGNFNGEFGYSGTTSNDIEADSIISNGRNVFGTDVVGSADGDSENVPASRIFQAIDPETGGGRLALNGGQTPSAALRDALDNPALSGGFPEGGLTDQRGVARPQPANTNPDIGSFELDQDALSTRPSLNNDAIIGGGARDVIRAQAGNDFVRGNAGNDELYGEPGSDTLFAAGGNDRAFGGPGADLVSGGPNVDQLTGGPGRDTFDLDQGHTGVGSANRDRLLDFRRGEDVIDLAGIDARSGTSGDQAFTFIGTRAFSGTGQLRQTTSGSDTVLQGSTDGDRSAELELQITGRVAFGAGDFVL